MGGIISMIIIGFIVGLIGRAIMPGDQKMGFLMTTGLGIGGSFVGGLLSSLFAKRPMTLNPAGVGMSIVGAVILLFVVGKLRSN